MDRRSEIITMVTSKLTAKAQTTIPLPVRRALHLAKGDSLIYHIEGGHVVLAKAGTATADDPFATFAEWASDADRDGYAGL
jgi:antitoxin PrlF